MKHRTLSDEVIKEVVEKSKESLKSIFPPMRKTSQFERELRRLVAQPDIQTYCYIPSEDIVNLEEQYQRLYGLFRKKNYCKEWTKISEVITPGLLATEVRFRAAQMLAFATLPNAIDMLPTENKDLPLAKNGHSALLFMKNDLKSWFHYHYNIADELVDKLTRDIMRYAAFLIWGQYGHMPSGRGEKLALLCLEDSENNGKEVAYYKYKEDVWREVFGCSNTQFYELFDNFCEAMELSDESVCQCGDSKSGNKNNIRLFDFDFAFQFFYDHTDEEDDLLIDYDRPNMRVLSLPTTDGVAFCKLIWPTCFSDFVNNGEIESFVHKGILT